MRHSANTWAIAHREPSLTSGTESDVTATHQHQRQAIAPRIESIYRRTVNSRLTVCLTSGTTLKTVVKIEEKRVGNLSHIVEAILRAQSLCPGNPTPKGTDHVPKPPGWHTHLR